MASCEFRSLGGRCIPWLDCNDPGLCDVDGFVQTPPCKSGCAVQSWCAGRRPGGWHGPARRTYHGVAMGRNFLCGGGASGGDVWQSTHGTARVVGEGVAIGGATKSIGKPRGRLACFFVLPFIHSLLKDRGHRRSASRCVQTFCTLRRTPSMLLRSEYNSLVYDSGTLIFSTLACIWVNS